MNKRDTAVSVIALKKLTKTVPKNTPRRELISEGRIKTLYFYRDDDEICVDSTLKKEFGLTNYLILDCDQSGNLSESTLKEMNGSRRRGLYICEVSFPLLYALCCIYENRITRMCLLLIVLHTV